MRNKRFLFALLCIGLFTFPRLAFSQNSQGGVDAVTISTKYYNSIVKVLLYDSVEAKTNPEKAYLGRGSGFFVSSDGYIFTNRHVISMCYNGFCRYKTYNADDKKFEEGFDVYSPALLTDPNITKITYVGRPAIIVQVYTDAKGDSSKLYHAVVVALDTMHFDGAILKITSDIYGRPVLDNFHPVPIGNSDSVKQGQDLCLFGFPAQYGGDFNVMLKDLSTLMFGKHSGYDYTYNQAYGFIKTDAAINSGNSGGPVFGPSNTVVGIATAAFEKTNVGLIGPIDGMYDVAALIPDLLKDAVANGLKPPAHKPGFSTATLYKPAPLPSPKLVKHSNNMIGKNGFASARTYLAIAPEYAFSSSNVFSINSYSDANYITNGGGKNSIPSKEFGVIFKFVKPTFLHQTNNLVGYYFCLEPSVFSGNWTSAKFVKGNGTSSDTISMDGTNADSEPFLYFSFGFSYTYLIRENIAVSVYYGPGVNLNPLPDNQMSIGTVNYQAQQAATQGNLQYTTSVASYVNIAGLTFKLKALLIGVEYHFGNTTNLTFQLPDINGSNTYTTVGGKSQKSSLSVTFGVAL